MGHRSLRAYHPVAVEDLIRVGRPNDGGYVLSKRSVMRAGLLFGFGINRDWSFEADFLKLNPGARVVGVDASVSSAIYRRLFIGAAARGFLCLVRGRWRAAVAEARSALEIRRLRQAFDKFFDGDRNVFIEKFLGPLDGPGRVSWQTLRREFGSSKPDEMDIFVKMDIEGSEYRTLRSLVADAEAISGIVVEFHDCDLLWERLEEVIADLSESFAICHVHGNNFAPLIEGTDIPRVLEISFVNRRLLSTNSPSDRTYPLTGLDMPCNPDKPDYSLQF